MRYVLYVRLAGQWVETDRFDASDNVDAFHKSSDRVDPRHRNCAIAFAPAEGASEGSSGSNSSPTVPARA